MIGHERSNVYPFQNNSSVHKSSAIPPPTSDFWHIFALNTQTPLPKVIPDVPERS